MLQTLFNYITNAAMLTLAQLLIVLGPLLVLAFVLNLLSRIIRTSAARLVGVNAYVWLTAPGVMVHEIGHAFFCILFGHRIVRMRLFSPQADGSLGSVEHSYNPKNSYQKIGNFFIGTGPIWFGTALICLLTWLLLDPSARHISTTSDNADIATIALKIADSAIRLFQSLAQVSVLTSWQFWVFLYLIFCIGSHITLSPPDIHGAAQGFISLVAFLFLFNLLTAWINANFTLAAGHWLMLESVLFYTAMAFVIGLNGLLAVVLYVIAGALRRR